MKILTKTLFLGTLVVGIVSASPTVLDEVQALDSQYKADVHNPMQYELTAMIKKTRTKADEELLNDPNIASQLRYQQLLKRLTNASRYSAGGVVDAAKREIDIANQLLSLPPHDGFPGLLSS